MSKRGFRHYYLKRLLDVDPITGCWIWLGRQSDSGYGLINTNRHGQWGSTETAQRYFFELYKRPLRDDEEAAHSCHRRSCCRPRHLSAKTKLDNLSDWFVDQQFNKEQIEEVIRLVQADLPVGVIADYMCCPRPYIHRLLRQIEWRNQLDFDFSL